VHRIERLVPGLYRWPSLAAPLRTGDLREEVYRVCLDQDLGRDAAFVLISAADAGALDDRGYREAQPEAGLVSGRLHLAAFALSIGASGMTFLDSEIPGLLREPLAALLFTCVGVPAYRHRPGGPPRGACGDAAAQAVPRLTTVRGSLTSRFSHGSSVTIASGVSVRRCFAMAERKPAKTGTQRSAKRTTGQASTGFTDEERAAMRERAQELKAGARRGQRAGKGDGESDLLAKIAEMPEADRAMAERLHAIIKASAPALSPRTWYGMPAYAKDGNVVCFFQSAQKFKTRYATLGFSDKANLDDGAMWPTAFALKELTAAEEARIGALVKQAVS
jgi:uncharacterized protein YdhG (YjbR/CyaY superfamily)